MLKVLDLFSGIGGFSLGLEATGGFETVGFCEIEPYPRAVLAKHWPDVPIYDDVRTLNHDGPVDVICGGYPCQPFSLAGQRRGAEDDRHLWPAMFALIQKHRPAWVIGENVAGHINMGLDEVLSDLESEGYATRAFVIPACAVNAPHRRDRVWIVANNTKIRSKTYVPYLQTDSVAWKFRGSLSRFGVFGMDNPRVCGMDDGLPPRVDRHFAIGNAVVPQVVEMIGRAILAAHYAPQNEGERHGQGAV